MTDENTLSLAAMNAGNALVNRHRMPDRFLAMLPGFIQQGMDRGDIAAVRDPATYARWTQMREDRRRTRDVR